MSSFIHLEELLERVENDRELMRDLLSIFKEEFPHRHQALRDAIESLDAPRVVLESHALKGMLSNLAAVEAAEAAARLESLARKLGNSLNPSRISKPSRARSPGRWIYTSLRYPDEDSGRR